MTGDNSGLESLSIYVTKLSVSSIVRNGHTFDLRRLTWLFQKFCCKDLDGIAQMQLRNWTNWYHKRSGSVTLPYGFLQQTANKKRWSAKTHMKPSNFDAPVFFFKTNIHFQLFKTSKPVPFVPIPFHTSTDMDVRRRSDALSKMMVRTQPVGKADKADMLIFMNPKVGNWERLTWNVSKICDVRNTE